MGAQTMKRIALLIGLAAVVGSTGCGGDDVPHVPPRFEDELHCDIGTSECQHRIYDSVAATLAVEGIERPAIRTISVDQHAQEVRSGLDLEDLTGEDATSRGLRLMGFIPAASESLTETQIEYWINAIAAYYSRGSRSITVIDRDYDDIDGQVILAHEFTHAIQDIQFNLNAVGANADTEDGVMGVRGVIEGDAMHTSLAWAYEKLGYLPEEIDWDAIHKERTDGLVGRPRVQRGLRTIFGHHRVVGWVEARCVSRGTMGRWLHHRLGRRRRGDTWYGLFVRGRLYDDVRFGLLGRVPPGQSLASGGSGRCGKRVSAATLRDRRRPLGGDFGRRQGATILDDLFHVKTLRERVAQSGKASSTSGPMEPTG